MGPDANPGATVCASPELNRLCVELVEQMRDGQIHAVFGILREEVRQWRLPAVGHFTQTPFMVLIACVLSLRTQDKTTYAASQRLFELAREPQAMALLDAATIEQAIYPVGFYKTKAKNIRMICRILVERCDGQVPDAIDALLKLPGVGRKTANLVVTLGFGKPGICVDTHVHRIANRWGYVQTKTPEADRDGAAGQAAPALLADHQRSSGGLRAERLQTDLALLQPMQASAFL